MQEVLVFLPLVFVAVVAVSGADSADLLGFERYLGQFPAQLSFHSSNSASPLLETKTGLEKALAYRHWSARHDRQRLIVVVFNVLLIASVFIFLVLRCFAAFKARGQWTAVPRRLAEGGGDEDMCSVSGR